MAKKKTQELLKRINYLEADIEIQKQILFSIPSDQKDEMEKTITIISQKNQEIARLREEIKTVDPEEYQRIVSFEEAINLFKQIASENAFETIVHKNIGEQCFLDLADGKKIDCLIKASDKNANWTVITPDGQLKQYPKEKVAEQPPEKNLQ
ncbi:hypothetical protein [Desulforhopalus singaporensis]|uniref:Uncharacterized protein n=1 Tax=Desulforhopalus singaporensis TaxID=91360 RepID=A0A1H0TPD1_9BACT|nr:hypothetical protein [Desulforhopalus singaporensis]SDP55912.1 hypothetical protein SAMN05660330_03198 [Desulforhopalus singaporensis]